MSQATSGGLDPVAKLVDVNGSDVFDTVHHLAREMETEYVFAHVVHGETYLAKWVDAEDAYWCVDGEVTDGETGQWDSESDHFSKDLPDGFDLVDLIGVDGQPRLLVSENPDHD